MHTCMSVYGKSSRKIYTNTYLHMYITNTHIYRYKHKSVLRMQGRQPHTLDTGRCSELFMAPTALDKFVSALRHGHRQEITKSLGFVWPWLNR